MKRRLVAVLVVCLVVGAPYDPINRSNFACIRFDMTPREVEELLGRKPDHAHSGVGTWVAKNGDEISVELLGGGISWKTYTEHPSFLERALDWLGLKQSVRE
jgi:hypothetical protein